MPIDGAVIRCPVPVTDLATDLADAPHAGVLWRAGPGRLLFHVPQVARYLVSGGNLIEIEPCAGAHARMVRRFLRMTPAAALYLQRGIPVLHAAVAVDQDGRAVALAGDSGSGKSVLLATLLRRGWRLLADDLAPVTLDRNHVPVAVPTWPEIRPWPGHAGLTTAGLDRGLGREFVREPRPISAIWWLGVHGGDAVETRAVEGIARFDAFGAMAYNRLIAGALLDRRSYLAVAAAVVGAAIPIRRLLRPRDRWTADELARMVSGGRPGRSAVRGETVLEPAQEPPHHQAPL
jgi:hypothetical protein